MSITRRTKTSRAKRPLAVTLTAAAMVVLFFARLTRALKPLIDQEFFSGGLPGPYVANGTLSESGWILLSSAFYLLLVIGLVFTLIGFLRLRRWSWVVLIVWTGLSLTYALAQYFYGAPNYLVLASDTIIALALNQSEVQKIFGVRAPAEEPAR